MTTRFLYITAALVILAGCGKNGENDSQTTADSLNSVTDSLQVDSAAAMMPDDFILNDREQRIYIRPEEPARYPGGKEEMIRFLQGTIVYPPTLAGTEAGGTVVVAFVIDEDGNLDNAEVLQPLEEELLNIEALKAVNQMPRWEPARVDDQPVKSRYILPISFISGS